jgi:hypothetical protein
MNRSLRVAAALVGLAAISTTTLAQRGSNRGGRDTCPTPTSRDRGSNIGFSISFGNTRGYHGSRFNNRYWGSNRGFSRAGHDFWIGSRGGSRYSNAHYGGHHGSYWSRSVAPVIHRPAVVCATPVVRAPRYRQPVIVERPVVVQRPVVVRQPTYEPIVRDVPVYRDIVPADPAQRYRAGWNALRAGDLAYAREFFADQALRYPDDPTPKAGLAIARGVAGLDDQAEWAMRRAVRAGLARARTGVPGVGLEAELARLEERYTDRSYTYNDRWFLLAATRYLLGDSAGAKDAAAQAISFDERDADARRIYDLVAHTG